MKAGELMACQQLNWRKNRHYTHGPRVASHSSDLSLAASWRTNSESVIVPGMEESRKRVIGIMASILASLHMQTADDLFHPRESPRTDKLIEASIQWAERIMEKIDERFRTS